MYYNKIYISASILAYILLLTCTISAQEDQVILHFGSAFKCVGTNGWIDFFLYIFFLLRLLFSSLRQRIPFHSEKSKKSKWKLTSFRFNFIHLLIYVHTDKKKKFPGNVETYVWWDKHNFYNFFSHIRRR